MKNAIRVAAPLLITAIALSSLCRHALSQNSVWKPKPKRGDAVKALVITGGHDHDSDFYSVFDDEGIRAVVDPYPNGLQNDIRKRADVLVLYDMLRQTPPEKQKSLRDFVESGKGVVVLHHGICGRVDWPWWYEEVVGGRWLFEPANGMPVSSYKHDEEISVKPVIEHPITKGIGAFRIWDETYKGLWISPKVKVLLETDHPLSDKPVAWIGPYEKARVVYIQLGHDRNANLNPNYQLLVRNAIRWAAGK
ncbi:MAG: ThuA domain-containing protein [Blastocatellia bacterium]